MVLEFVNDFIWTYYLTPGYNIVNTLTYGLVLGFLIFKLMPALKGLLGDIDRRFALMLSPFIFFGATMRELVDQNIGLYAGHTQFPQNYMYVSPGIYFTMFFLTLAVILLSFGISRAFKIAYQKPVFIIGFILAAYNFSLIVSNIKNPGNLFLEVGFFSISMVLLYALTIILKLDFLKFELNWLVITAHLLDATSTFVGVDFMSYTEKHVLPTFFINVFGTAAVMYPLKLLVLIPALYMIDQDLKDDKFQRRFIKFVIVVLGLGPAIRNSTLLLMG